MMKQTGLVKLSPQEAFTIHRRIDAYECAEYRSYQTDCANNRAFFYGDQYTADEISAQQDRGQYTLVINKCRKYVNGLVGLLTASQPKFNVVPRGANDTEISQLGVQLLDWVWSNSGGLQSFRKVVKAAARDNIAYFHIVYTDQGAVKFVPLLFDDVLVDTKTRDPLFTDAEAIYIVRWLPVERVKVLYGVDNLSYDTPAELTALYSEQNVTPITTNRLFSVDKQYVKVYEGYKKVYLKNEQTGIVDVRIEKETLLGFFHAYREYLPPEITEYPIIPVYAEDTDNPYKRGEIYFLKGIQRFINKSHGVVLLNAQLMSNPKLILRENDIPNMDREKFENNYAKPASVSIISQNAQEPIIIQGQPLNSAFFALHQDIKRELEAQTIPQEILGYSDSAQRNQLKGGPTMLEIKEAVLDSLRFFTSNIDSALSQTGLVSLQFCRAYLQQKRLLKITDSERKYTNLLTLNQVEQLQLDSKQSVEAFVRNKIRQGVSEEEVKDMLDTAHRDQKTLDALKYIMNDVTTLDTDVLVVPGSYSPSYQMANLRLAMELQDRGVVDGEAVLKHAPIEDRDEIRDRVSTIRKQNDYIMQLEEQLKKYEGEAESLRRSIAGKDIEMIVADARLKQDKIVNDTRAKAYVEKHRQRMETREVIDEIRKEGERLLQDAKSERETDEGPGIEPSILDLIARG